MTAVAIENQLVGKWIWQSLNYCLCFIIINTTRGLLGLVLASIDSSIV